MLLSPQWVGGNSVKFIKCLLIQDFRVRFWSVFRFAKLQENINEIWLAEAYMWFQRKLKNWKQECLKLLETNDRVSVGEHWTKKEVRHNEMLQKHPCSLAVMLFVPMMGKDSDPVATWSRHHRSSDCDFQAGWARSGFHLRWHVRAMVTTGKNTSARHGAAATKDLPSPGISPAPLQSFSSCHGARRSRAWQELVLSIPLEKC